MSYAFTEFIRGLGAADSPTAEAFEELWHRLSAALAGEIKRRGLWRLPPSYLGVTGGASWRESTVDELVAPCYQHIFIDRLGGLLAQLQVKDNVDGLVRLHVRNFVHEQQRRHDPLGFRLYNVLRRALRAAIDDGELEVVSGDQRLRSDTVLAFSDARGGEPTTASPELLAEQVRLWNDELLPDLVTAQGPAQASVATRLRQKILEDLPMAGVRTFCFADVLDPLKTDVRRRWARLLDQDLGDAAFDNEASGDGDGGWPQLVRRVEAADDLEQIQHFEALVGCVTDGVDRHPGSKAARRHLSTLWQFLRSWSADEYEDVEEDGALPSRRRLSTLLRIPRDRMPGLFSELGKMIESCSAAILGNPAVRSLRDRENATSTSASAGAQGPPGKLAGASSDV